MTHSFTSSLYHCAFSTKGRQRLITAKLQSRLWPCMGGIARENGMKALAIGGVEDHAHPLLSLPSTLAIAQAEHHRQKTFQEEFLAFLRKHGIAYDERYIWD